MASMTTRKVIDFKNDDHYNTTKDMWKNISHLIPKDKILFEGFMKDNYSSTSIVSLQELGFDVVGDPTIDFFGEIPKYDILVSNPPYSIKKKIFERLSVLNKPFILILPISTITKQYIKVLDKNKLQMIIPSKRMQFEKANIPLSRCWFDTCYLCYKMNLERDITFI